MSNISQSSKEDYKKFFKLQKGEVIIDAIKPLPQLKIALFLQNLFGWLFFSIFAVFFLGPVLSITLHKSIFWIFLIFVFFILLIVPAICASLLYKHLFYWITNKRIIIKRGFIGYRINSIPLERISDVIISRSFFERIMGYGSLYIQSLAGQISYKNNFGAEGYLRAIPNPEDLQQKIFHLIQEKRKRENITM